MASSSTAPSQTTPTLVTTTSVMSQDIVSTASITVDTTSVTPLAPFLNPASAGALGNLQTETLAVVNGQVNHVARNPATDSGWQMTPISSSTSIQEVAAGTAYASSGSPSAYGFYHDGVTLNWTQLQSDGVTWSAPTAMPTLATNLRVAYSPAGQVVLYGATATGDLLLVYQTSIGGAFVSTTCVLDGVLSSGDFSLCMVTETAWSLAANASGSANLYQGTLTSMAPSAQQIISGFTGNLAQVALSFYASTQNTMMFLLVDSSGQLHVYAQGSSGTGSSQPILNSTVAKASGFVSSDGSLHVYSVDNDQGLWVLHQNSQTPWSYDSYGNPIPQWASIIPLDNEVGGLATDMNPADAPTLFVVDGGDASLRLHAQDSTTQMWNTGQLLAALEACEVSRFRTEVNVLNAYSSPMPNQSVTVQVADGGSAVDLWIAGQIYQVTSDAPVTLQTDGQGKLTFSTLTYAGIATPNLTFTANGLANSVPLSPSAPLHTYLSGNGTLNLTSPNGGLQQFDAAGTTLTNAKNSQGQPLAPSLQGNTALATAAAQAIQQTALYALNQPGAQQYTVVLSASNPSYSPTASQELSNHLAALRAQDASLGGFWNDIESWPGDVWEGIKNGVAKIVGFVVTVAEKTIINLALQIGNAITQQITLALQGVEQAAQAIAGVFQAVAADIEDVIDWLKAMFDFTAIWNTKMAFEQALIGLPAAITNAAGLVSTNLNQWFSAKENDINNAFTKLIANYTAGETLSSMPNFPTPGQPLNSTNPIAGNMTAADCSNVHNSWLQDKVSAYAPATSPVTPGSGLVSPWQSFVSSLEASGSDLETAVTDFVNAIQAFWMPPQQAGAQPPPQTLLYTDPSQIGNIPMVDLLSGIQSLIDAVLSLCDAVVQGLLALVDAAMEALGTMLTTPFSLEVLHPLQAVWTWLYEQAGSPASDPSQGQLTLGGLLALVGAFPCTILYKLVNGVNNEPCPTGALPTGLAGAAQWAGGSPNFPGLMMDTGYGCNFAAGLLQMVSFLPAEVSALLGVDTPWWVSAMSMATTGIIFGLQNGIPNLTGDQWGAVAGVASSVLATIPMVGFLLRGAQETLAPLGQFAMENSSKAMSLVLTVVGLVELLFAVAAWAEVQGTDNAQPASQTGSNLLSPLSSLVSFLQLPVFAQDPEVAAFTIPANVVVDAISYMGGGACQAMYVTQIESGSATAAATA